MSKEAIDLIQLMADKNPESFVKTIACLGNRRRILDSMDDINYCHDSLASQYKTNYVRTLENCDSMLAVVFEKEYTKFQMVG